MNPRGDTKRLLCATVGIIILILLLECHDPVVGSSSIYSRIKRFIGFRSHRRTTRARDKHNPNYSGEMFLVGSTTKMFPGWGHRNKIAPESPLVLEVTGTKKTLSSRPVPKARKTPVSRPVPKKLTYFEQLLKQVREGEVNPLVINHRSSNSSRSSSHTTNDGFPIYDPRDFEHQNGRSGWPPEKAGISFEYDERVMLSARNPLSVPASSTYFDT